MKHHNKSIKVCLFTTAVANGNIRKQTETTQTSQGGSHIADKLLFATQSLGTS